MLTPSILNSCRRKTKAGKNLFVFLLLWFSCALLLISFLGFSSTATAGCFRTDIVIAGGSTLVDATELGDIACCCVNDHCVEPKEPNRMWSKDMMLSYGRMPGGKYMLNWPIEGNFLGKRKK